jgi:kynurenine formamidase
MPVSPAQKNLFVIQTKGTGMKYLPFIGLLIVVLAAAGCVTKNQNTPVTPARTTAPSGTPAGEDPVAARSGYTDGLTDRILDMTYAYDENTIYWPNAVPFNLTPESRGITERGYWYAANFYAASEHGGTHADAPLHFAENGRTIDQVPLEEWIGPAVKIDMREQCARDRDYLMSVDDIKNWENKYGRIPAGAWVIMYTGIGTQYYPDPVRVLGTDKKGLSALPELSFPAFSKESAEFLVKERNITGIAIDTPSIDYGRSQDFFVHRVICGANKLGLENIASLDKLPEKGAMLYVIPMSIKGGTGAPARVFAILP